MAVPTLDAPATSRTFSVLVSKSDEERARALWRRNLDLDGVQASVTKANYFQGASPLRVGGSVNASLLSGYTGLVQEAIRRARARIKAGPDRDATLDVFDEATLEPVLLGAFQRASLAILTGRSPVDWLGPEREQLLDRLAVAMVDELRRPSGLDSRTMDHATFRLDRHSFDLLIGQLWRCRTAHIQAALERADYEDAAVRALVCAATPIPLPAQMTADVLVGVEQARVFVALGRQVLPKDTGPLHDLIRRSRLPATTVGTEQTALTMFLLWKLERPDAKMLLPHLRSLARARAISTQAAGWVLWLARQLGDSSVNDIFAARQVGAARGAVPDLLVSIMGKLLPDYWEMPIDDVVTSLHQRISDVGLDGIPARAASRTGRNEPCPCGSGRKYKRCCADKPAVIAPSTERARLERLQEAAPRLDRDQIARLSRADLGLLELSRLRDPAVVHVMRKHVVLRDWKRVALALDEIARRHGHELADGHVEDVAHEALIARQYDIAEGLLARVQDPTARAQLRLELDLATRAPEALPQLEAAALAALKDDDDPLDVVLMTLRTTPALGILVARGVLHDCGELEREMLLELIEDARDVLLLPPGDPATAQLQSRDEAPKTQPAVHEASHVETTRAAELQAEIDRASKRLVALQRQVDERERNLARTERAAQEQRQRALQAATDVQPQQAAQAATDLRAQRTLRDKIDALQARIREGNEERARLRRQLSEAVAGDLDTSGPASTVASGAAEPMDDDGDAIPFVSTNRALLYPQFTDSAKTSFGSVPRSVASQAMRTVAGLAAGDPAAWRSIKQAKDMRRQVLMARVGIHHRLLFRVESTVLDVLDVVTRESLLMNLKRMRSG